MGNGCTWPTLWSRLLAGWFQVQHVWWEFKLARSDLWVLISLKAAGSLLGWTASLLIFFVNRARHQLLADWESATILSVLRRRSPSISGWTSSHGAQFWYTSLLLGRMSYGKWRLYESCGCRGRNTASDYPHIWPRYARSSSYKWRQCQAWFRSSFPWLCLVLRSRFQFFSFLFCPTLSRAHGLWNFLPTLQYFHADNGRGLGASHQTGWSGLVAYHILQSGVNCRLPKTPRSESLFCSKKNGFLDWLTHFIHVQLRGVSCVITSMYVSESIFFISCLITDCSLTYRKISILDRSLEMISNQRVRSVSWATLKTSTWVLLEIFLRMRCKKGAAPALLATSICLCPSLPFYLIWSASRTVRACSNFGLLFSTYHGKKWDRKIL